MKKNIFSNEEKVDTNVNSFPWETFGPFNTYEQAKKKKDDLLLNFSSTHDAKIKVFRVNGRQFNVKFRKKHSLLMEEKNTVEMKKQKKDKKDKKKPSRSDRGTFADAIGKWPGNESDEEVEAALRDVE